MDGKLGGERFLTSPGVTGGNALADGPGSPILPGEPGMPKSFRSLKGQLLLDGGRLAGSYFRRTVVLLCEHNAEGAFGLVLNRPSENRLEDVFPGELPSAIRDAVLFAGGPVQPAALSYLYLPPEGVRGGVLPGLSVGHDLQQLIGLGSGATPPRFLRVFAGYAGWSPGQLDGELRRGSWLVHRAPVEFLVTVPPAEIWRRVLRSRPAWEERLLADSPEDLSVN